jgi:hypothetical protein
MGRVDAGVLGVPAPDGFRQPAARYDRHVARVPEGRTGLLDGACEIDARNHGVLADHAGPTGHRKTVFIVQTGVENADQNFARGERSKVDFTERKVRFSVFLSCQQRFERGHSPFFKDIGFSDDSLESAPAEPSCAGENASAQVKREGDRHDLSRMRRRHAGGTG